MDLYQKLLKLNEHIYKVLKKIENGEDLEYILNDFYETEEQIYNSLSFEELDELLKEILLENQFFEERIFLLTLIKNSELDPYTSRILFQLLSIRNFYKMQESTRLSEKEIDTIFHNPYFNRIKKNKEDLYKIEYLLNQEYQKEYSLDSFYLKNIFYQDKKNYKIEKLDSYSLELILISVSNTIYDILLEELEEEEIEKLFTYLKCIFKVIPKEYHKDLFFEIKSMYDLKKEEKEIHKENVVKLQEFLNSLGLSLEQKIEGYSTLDDIDSDEKIIVDFTKDEINEYEFAYQNMYHLSTKLLKIYEEMIQRKIMKKEDEDLFKIYRLYETKENEILSNISDYEKFCVYMNICYGKYHLNPLPYPIIHYTESILEKKTLKDLENIEQFLHMRNYKKIMFFINKKEKKETEENDFENDDVDVIYVVDFNKILERLNEVIDYLLGIIDKEEFEEDFKDFLDFREEMAEENFDLEESLFLLGYIKGLANSIPKMKEKNEKEFFTQCFYFLIFLDGRLMDNIINEKLNLQIKRINLEMDDKYSFQKYREYLEECLESLKDYKSEREKKSYEVYEKTYKQFLKENECFFYERKKKE